MDATLELVSFGLPDTFPPEAVPTPLAQFVAACVPGLSKGQLISRTRKLDWRPTWKRMPKFDTPEFQAFEFRVTVSGKVVPLIVRMRSVGKGTRPLTFQSRDPRQMSLF